MQSPKQLLGRRVLDCHGRRAGTVAEVLTDPHDRYNVTHVLVRPSWRRRSPLTVEADTLTQGQAGELALPDTPAPHSS